LINPAVPAVPDKEVAPDMYKPSVESAYRIQVGDKLRIQSYYDTQLNQDVTVRPDGRVSLLLINDVNVTGSTTSEISRRLSNLYSEHIQSAKVTVSIIESRKESVYIGGQVKLPSERPLNRPLTVLQAITMVGGFLPSANTNQVLVLRRQKNGGFKTYQLDIDKVLVNQAPDVYLKRYDVVYVPMSRIAHVGKFVNEYINQIIPKTIQVNATYTWVEQQ
jgi:protein involved in polysaccharide export with SLBB domain